MIAFGYFLKATAGVLHLLLQFFYWLMIARVILSWVSPDPRNPIVQFIYNTTEPMLSKIRERIPPLGMIDLSPIVWFAVLYFLDVFLTNSLLEYGNHFLLLGGASGGIG